MFEIRSGQSCGEIYSHEVFWARTHEAAEACRLMLTEKYQDQENWFWGPHVYEWPDYRPEEILVWDGHEEVPAPEYNNAGQG